MRASDNPGAPEGGTAAGAVPDGAPPLGVPVPGWKGATVPERVSVEGCYCQLQPLADRHAAALWEATGDHPELWTYLPYGPFADSTAFARWIEAKTTCTDARFFAICDRHGAASGFGSFLRIDAASGSVEVGNLLFSPRLQRTREATEAMFLAMRTAFQHGFRRYEWKCNALNAPSRAAALRLGFTYEGTFRQACVAKGRNRDTAWYSVIDTEWPTLKAAFERWLDPDNFDPGGRQIFPLASFH